MTLPMHFAGTSKGRRRLLGMLPAAGLIAGMPELVATLIGSRRLGTSAQAADLPALIRAIKPCVVAIGTYSRLQNPNFRFRGTGFAIAAGDQVVTCAHVLPVIEPGEREVLAIAVPDGETARIIEARLGLIDRDADLAVLKVDGVRLPSISVDEREAREGADVVMVGFPIGSALGLVAAAHRGLVAAVTPMVSALPNSASLSARNVYVMRGPRLQLLQLDVTSYPGNSGSPLVDVDSGKVVGIVNMGLVKGSREAAVSSPTGISYAVPVRYLAALLSTR